MNEGRWLDGDQDPAAIALRRALDEARLATADDVTLRRMWGRVADPGQRRRRTPRWFWFLSGMATTGALAFGLGVWLSPHPKLSSRPTAPTTVASAPAPSAARNDQGTALEGPGTVRTGAGETLRLTLRGGTEARLGSSSVMSLDEQERPTVEGGEVGFKVPHQPSGHSFVVRAGPFRVVVVGTKFGLRVEDGGRVMVSVDEGTVEVWNRTRLARLAPGERWESEPAPAQEREQGEEQEPAPAPAQHSAHARGPHARTVALATPDAPGAKPGAPAAAPASDVALAPGGDAAADARAALAAGDATRALALYRALAQRGGPAGENAEYEIGKILRDRLGQPASAIAAWRHYRSDHPNGILRVEADVSIIEALAHTGEPDAALGEANDFLRRYPSSERRAEIARLAGDLYRSRGDCQRAVGAYEVALGSPHAANVAEAATFHRAACLVRLGDAGGVEAARAYLRTWPAGRFRDEASALLAGSGRTSAEGRTRP